MDWILQRFAAFGSKTACITPARSWTFVELTARIQAHAAALPAERSVIPIPCADTVEALAHLIAVASSRHIALPLSPNLSAAEQSNMRRIAGLDGAPQPRLYHQLEESGLVIFSSGTSGAPKGMLHRLPALLQRFQSVGTRDDRTLQLLLIDHIGGLDAALRCLCAGSTLAIPESRTPAAAGQAIATFRVNVLPASPTFLNLMLLEAVPRHFDCGSVEIIAYGAEPMPEPLLARLHAEFPQARLQQKFGTSETGAVRIRSEADDSLFFRIEDPDTEWKVVDDELWLKTPSRIIGYLNADASALETDGWYRTGDLVESSASGIRIIGRESQFINVGGQKVHPSEVEAILCNMEGIDACRVFGEADPITGQHVACEIASRLERDSRVWKREIRQYGRGKLAPWKLPSSVRLLPTPELNDRLKRQ